MKDKPILLNPGVEPIGVLRGIAYDLINYGTSEGRRAGRRILGVIASIEKARREKPT